LPTPAGSTPERWICLLVGLLVGLWLLGFCRGHLSGSDELNVFETTRAITERGSLAIPPVPNSRPGRDGRFYSPYAVGQPVAGVPFFALGLAADALLPDSWRRALAGERLVRDVRTWSGEPVIFTSMLYGPVMTGLLVALFFLIQRELGASLRSAIAASLLLGTCTYVAPMSSYLLRHTSEGVTVLSGLYFLIRFERSGARRDLAAGSLCASLTLLARLPGVVVALGFAVFLLPLLHARWRASRDPRAALRDLLAALAPAAVVLSLHMASNAVRWGTLLASPMLDEDSRFPYPIWLSAWGFLLSPGASIFVYSPLLLLAPAGLRALAQPRPRLVATILTVFASFLVFFSLYDGWTGLWAAPGPRYLFIPLLFLMLPLGPWLDGGRAGRRWGGALALGAFGLIVQVALLSTHFGTIANEMGWPDYKPKWSFLFIPDANGPVPAALRALLSGRHLDVWLVRLASGWPGTEAHPGAAAVLACFWLLALALCAAWLRRLYRRSVASA